MFPLHYLPETSSTNDAILNILLEHPAGVAVFTFHQTAGKGQYGNKWTMTKDENLAYSIAVKCENVFLTGNLFNYHTAILVRNFLANMADAKVEIKWPNDLIINHKKICGILIEKMKSNFQDYYIIGIGINVLQKDFDDIKQAGSLLTQTGKSFVLNEFAQSFHEYFSENILIPTPEEAVLTQFNQNLYRKNAISVFELNGLRQNGIIKNADENGFLWIDLENDGLQKFFFKEIEMLY